MFELPRALRARFRRSSGAAPAVPACGSPALVEPLESRQLMTVPAGFSETPVGAGIFRPTSMALAPDGRIFVAQKSGAVRIIKNGTLLSTPFLNVTVQNTGERGLLGVAIDPNFTSNRHVYVYYTRSNGSGGYVNRVSRFTASSSNGDVVQSGSELVLIEGDTLGTSTAHNGGALQFGGDGKLYVAIGDNRNTSGPGQTNNLFGKILRINTDGSIPSDNPFYGSATGKYRAIWALGLRNPYTIAFQPGTGRLFINDVGEATYEEINDGKPGANYGWPSTEGPTTNPSFTSPFYYYAHTSAGASITGGAFYNPANATFPSGYLGDYFFGDWVLGTIKRIDTTTKTVNDFATNAPAVLDLDVGPDGSLYYLSYEESDDANGRVYRIQATTPAQPVITSHPQGKTVALGEPVTFSVTATGSNLTYQWQRNGSNIAGATSASFTINSTAASDDDDVFRVLVSNAGGTATSNGATLNVVDSDPPTAAITSPSINTLWTAGGTLSFAGTGTDPEDGTLPASAFTWQIDFHHDQHHHPFVAPYSGVKSDTVDLPDDGEVDPDVWYRIHLTVTDSTGLTHSTFRDVFPQKVNLTLQTAPAGLSLNLDGQPVADGYTTPAVVGLKRTLGAPATQVLNGVVYEFTGWSDGGNATHDVFTPNTNTTYTATYKVSEQQVVALPAAEDAYVRDGGSASTNYGSANILQTKTDSSGYNRQTYLKFDLSTFNGAISDASLRLFARLNSSPAAPATVNIFGGPDNWAENTLTWNNKPASGTQLLASFTVTSATGTAYSVNSANLTSYLVAKKAGGATVATLVLKSAASGGTTVVIGSSEAANSNERPQLTVRAGGQAPAPTIFRATADALVRDGSSASTNFGSSNSLEAKVSRTVGNTRESYLRFDLSGVTTVSSAKLRLYGRLTDAGTLSTSVFASTNVTWNESAITWNTKPATSGTAKATITVSGTTSQWYEWDVTDYLQDEFDAGRKIVTLVLRNPQQTTPAAMFQSDEAATNRPELVVGG